MLISDNLFRAKNTLTRKTYVQLAEIAEKKYSVNVAIIGTMSPAGERLKLMTGVAAILRYSLPGIDEIEEDDDEDSDEDNKDPFRISE
jgi:protein pelota